MRMAWWSAFAAVLIGSTAWGQSVEQTNWGRRWNAPPCCPPVSPYAPDLTRPSVPPSTDPNAAQPPATDAFSQAGESGTLAASSFAPAFFGDLIGFSGTRVVRNANGSTSLARAPILARSGGYKIAENESPRPVNRVFYAFNFYNDVNLAVNPGLPPFDVYRHVIGFEKTLLGGDASFGLRIPFVRITGPAEVTENRISDLNLIFKYAFYNDLETGDVLSGGLVLTVPTGGGILVDVPNAFTPNPNNLPPVVNGGSTQVLFYPVIFQPFAGWIRTFTDRIYLHGFHSLAVPTDGRDVTLLFNDVGIGFWLYRNPADRFVQAIVPTFEFHLNTPLNHRGLQSVPIGFADQLNLTLGGYVLLPRSTFGFAAGLPVVGPRPYDVEATMTFTLRF